MADMQQDLPPDLAAEQMRIARRRQLAEALLAQSQRQQPIQHWTQGLAQLANAYLGKQGLDKADAASQALNQRAQAGQQAELSQIQGAMAPQPAITLPADQAGPTRPEMPASRDKVREALVRAQMSAYPQVRQFGAGQQKFVEQDEARADAAASKLDALQQAAQARADQIRLAAEQGRISREEADARHADLMKELKKMGIAAGGGNGAKPYFTPVYTADGVISFDTRSGQASPVMVGGKQAVRSTDDPETQAKITAAKTGAKAGAERDFNMSGVTDIIGQARSLLSGPVKPTGSGAGVVADTAGALVGVAPSGAAEADQLRAVAGALTSKMPRMEGPQSDRDTQLYREMAGQVGNASLPVSRRLAALQQVEAIVSKYDKSSAAAPAAGKVRRYNPATGKIE